MTLTPGLHPISQPPPPHHWQRQEAEQDHRQHQSGILEQHQDAQPNSSQHNDIQHNNIQ
jgi:hypothetical protein